MAKKITNNLGLKLLSILIAAILWFVAININDPISQQSYLVNVSIENLDKLVNSGKYVEIKTGTDVAKVTVVATRSELKDISDKNIMAVADVDKYNAEDGTVPIEVKVNKSFVKEDDIKIDDNYKNVSLLVENIKRRQLPISVNVAGELDENYMLGGTSTAQNGVLLSGPESLINAIDSVSVDIDINGATSDVNISLPIHLFNAEGKEVSDNRISRSINNVSTTATIWLVKSIPVEYRYVGEPAEGYQVQGSTRSDINHVTLAGKPNVIKNINKLDISEAIDITGANKLVESTIDLKKRLPEGLVFADSQDETKANLSVRINKIPQETDDEEEVE